jgi:Transposase, Mutator family
MARNHPKPTATIERRLDAAYAYCWTCGKRAWITALRHRRLLTLDGVLALTLPIRQCRNVECIAYKHPVRPWEEGALALPQAECGLDVIAFVGACRYQEHRSVPEIHRLLKERGVPLSERTVTNLLYRYEELLALRLADPGRLRALLQKQGRVVLALDGMQPDVGHEVLWVIRDLLSAEVLLARSLLSETASDVGDLLREVQQSLPVPIVGVVSDGQHSLRHAVAQVLPGVPHQLCQFHYLREAAKPIYEADRHAKKELKKQVRGIREIERQGERAEGGAIPEADAVRAYCHAVRSALTDDGRAPLAASGLKLRARLQAIMTSLERVQEKGEPFPA